MLGVVHEILARQMTVLGDLAAPGIVERIERFQKRNWSFTLSARALELKKPVKAKKKYTGALPRWAEGGHLLWTADELLDRLAQHNEELRQAEAAAAAKKLAKAQTKKDREETKAGRAKAMAERKIARDEIKQAKLAKAESKKAERKQKEEERKKKKQKKESQRAAKQVCDF